MNDIAEILQAQAWERAKGELCCIIKAVTPMPDPTRYPAAATQWIERRDRRRNMIGKFIEEMESELHSP